MPFSLLKNDLSLYVNIAHIHVKCKLLTRFDMLCKVNDHLGIYLAHLGTSLLGLISKMVILAPKAILPLSTTERILFLSSKPYNLTNSERFDLNFWCRWTFSVDVRYLILWIKSLEHLIERKMFFCTKLSNFLEKAKDDVLQV